MITEEEVTKAAPEFGPVLNCVQRNQEGPPLLTAEPW